MNKLFGDRPLDNEMKWVVVLGVISLTIIPIMYLGADLQGACATSGSVNSGIYVYAD